MNWVNNTFKKMDAVANRFTFKQMDAVANRFTFKQTDAVANIDLSYFNAPFEIMLPILAFSLCFIACNPTCLTCTGDSIDSCTSCRSPLLLRNGRCDKQCMEGQYSERSVCLGESDVKVEVFFFHFISVLNKSED